ncbi:NADH-quinone oxidoreductase subunit F [Actinoplanes sp. TBRC 11911]|uniref:NADH-ubiquinone oxidoreductase-F iron-sulfur binding region domain-containing protein n=1 Tax=Actinoplanes sp. TBRC 11911 TaxID=2729386 RepID=UPI00145C6E33|nr:NADH-ubiquinone oxidoreductase-F iron-sulfur binding region domain-containing protein [Actinoplanes sp. TBRC 11911]NMO54584.1 NADH-quinone oxidoreductase subunit F [Actinoplanes sp. TBRC 11911]
MTTVAEPRLLGEPVEAYVPKLDPKQVIDLARQAGLTGRGGAGFPVGRKLAAVAATGRPAMVIANGAEGEPGSEKDRYLLTHQPHLVLDGLQLVARACHASALFLYAPPAALEPVRRALWDRRREAVSVRLAPAPSTFVAGEASAAAAAVVGGGAIPADKMVRLAKREMPTLVQNVETLAHLALVARHGAEWFRTRGTQDEPGTFLATVGGAVVNPQVVEAGYGVPLGELLAAAGGPSGPLSAVLVGGYHGGWVPADPELPVSRAGLDSYGATPGAGVVTALPASSCGLRETARIVEYLAGQVSGQCGPCLNGLPRMASALSDLAHHRIWLGMTSEVDRLRGLVTGRGACHHPDATARLIGSAMRMFHEDVTAHLKGECVAR